VSEETLAFGHGCIGRVDSVLLDKLDQVRTTFCKLTH